MIADSIFRTGPERAFSPGFPGRNGMLRDIGTATSGPSGKGRAAGAGKLRRPWKKTLAARYSPAADCRSTLATGALHFRVRNGNGCCLPAMATKEKRTEDERSDNRAGTMAPKRRRKGKAQASRTISTGRVNALPRLRLRPIEVVVFHRP